MVFFENVGLDGSPYDTQCIRTNLLCLGVGGVSPVVSHKGVDLLIDGCVQEHGQNDGCWPVDGHRYRCGGRAQIESRIQHTHVIQGGDRYAAFTDLAVDVWTFVWIFTVQSDAVERCGQPVNRFALAQKMEPRIGLGGAALGVVNTSQWNKDIDNPTNAAFVESFQAEYGRLPSLYASQGFDTANLLLSALESASPSDADAFREALRAADFDSTRGDFAFGPNHHPIQTIYAREVIQEGDVFTNKIIGTALENHSDAYAADCKM